MGVLLLDWPVYLAMITANAPGVRIAEKTGMPESTISRWLSGKAKPNPKQVVAVARAYEANPMDALMAAGYIAEEDLEKPVMPPMKADIRQFTDLELAEEMVRRIAAGQAPLLQQPLDGDHPAMQQLKDNGSK